MFLGFGEHTSDNYFDGGIDDFAIWDDHLTAAEITAIHGLGMGADLTSDSGNYASSSNLELFYDFNGSSASTVDDKTGNSSQDGVIVNATRIASRSSIIESTIIPTKSVVR